MKKIVLLITLSFLISLGYSQSLLWKVSGKDLKSPSYVYGTIHIQDNRVFSFDSTIVIGALESCEAFAMEILMDEIDPKELQKSMYMPKGKTLNNMMSKEDYDLLDKVCKKKLHASVMFMNTLKPFFLSSAISQADIPQDQTEALDLYFLKKARNSGKHCYGVEKYEVQVNAIDAISLKDQVNMLVEQLHQLGVEDTVSDDGNDFQNLLHAYMSFDLEEMIALSNDESMPAKFNKVFLIDRNKGMAKNFALIAREHSLFCAVGAAHLGGPKGVLNLLRKMGYTVEPVLFQWGSDIPPAN